ncbi:Hpt domain-containing protein [Arthrobacter sp. UKPF54-2]|uniref:Hpt domain-containing protein n=1 Tax=Arthrobacter sp. UKPF54-2 TaxID=2600159 RepID=UPI0011B0FF17|nr:Hpt domain-containing protein [Arthrobacter sp. UKPF54-2]QDY90405.1 Hpt domain-containing protein [Arthrobacter sp. UKPF54-2]
MSLLAACPDDGKTGPVLAAEAPAGGAPLAAPGSGAAPLVDPAALQDLGEQLNSAAVAKGFARDYAQMWDRRYEALATALDRRDQAAALDAALSLKTSSSMVGGLRLAELAADLEEAIRSGHLAEAASRLDDVAARGSETVDELQFSYILWER